MKVLKSLIKLSSLFVRKKYIDIIDISNSYTKVSSNYNNSFLNQMHKYNEEMLERLISENKDISNGVNVLDLACGTGFNSRYIHKRLNCTSFTLVDISKGMLSEARALNSFNCDYVENDMISYLKYCKDNTFDIVICAWAIKYQNPHKIISELKRVLKKDGFVAVIVNLKGTLPEVRKVYPSIIKAHIEEVNKIMLELPNPISEGSFNRWFTKKGFKKLYSKSAQHRFNFKSTEELVKWLTSTGALAGFDTMVNMEDDKVKKTMTKVFDKNNIDSITHKFVWGIYVNEK